MKGFYKILVGGILFGFLLGYGRYVFEENFGTLSTVQLIFIILLIVILIFLFMVMPTLKLRRKLIKIIYELDQGGDVNKYIKDIKELLNKKKGFFDIGYYENHKILKVDLAVGYLLKKEYAKATKILKTIDVTNVRGPQRAGFYANYAFGLFQQSRTSEALDIMKNNMNVFKSFYTFPNIGTVINICYIYMMISEERFNDIVFYLQAAKDTAKGAYQKEEVKEMEAYLVKKGYIVDNG